MCLLGVLGCSAEADPLADGTATGGSGSQTDTVGEGESTDTLDPSTSGSASMTGGSSSDTDTTLGTTATGSTTEADSSGTDAGTTTDPSDTSSATDPSDASSSSSASESSSGSGGGDDDSDNDGVPDDDDNCPDDANPNQADGDNDAIGDICDDDGDNDGVPDGDDPFPDDADLPGTVLQATIYAHTSGALYTMEVDPPYAIALVGNFSFPSGSPGSVTDVAIDQFGVLYAVTFDDLFVCDPDTAACYYLGDLPESHNALTFVPPGTVDANDDALIGIANSGSWRHLQLNGNMVALLQLGSYGGGYTSSGDAFSIEGVGTYASVNAGGEASDVIIEVDPLTGNALAEITTLDGYTSTYGLAGWEGAIFAFDESGAVLLVDPNTGAVELINDTNTTWWGAGVGTILPQ